MQRAGNRGIKNKFKLRKIIKVEFCKRHTELLDSIKTNSWLNSPEQRNLIELARKEIGFSVKTSDCDICCSIKRFHKQTQYIQQLIQK